jgi:hypothetical protein
MPFNRENAARVLPRPGNPSKEAVECLASFFLEQLRQNKISNEQFAILDRADFDQDNKARGSSKARFYDDTPRALTRRKNIIRNYVNRSRIHGVDLVPAIEHLLEKDSDGDGRGDQKLLRLVNKLGFNLEFYTTFRKRAIARLLERARDRARAKAIYTGEEVEADIQNPSEMEIKAEIDRMCAILQLQNEHEKPALELLANTAYQPQDPNRPVLKLFFDNDGHVCYESSLAAHLVPAAPAAQARPQAAAKPANNYMNNANIFGNYYDSPQGRRPLPGQFPSQFPKSGHIQGQAPAFAAQPGRPSFEQSIGVIVGIFGSFLAKFFEMLMGARKQSETVLKNANPYRPLALDEQRGYNADLFEDFRTKLSDENKRNRLVQAWREANTAAERATVIASLKESLADARLHEDLQTLNFKLCLRSLEEDVIPKDAAPARNIRDAARNRPLDKAHLLSLWRQGPEKRRKALHILHQYMAERGLYRQMEESLRDLEYSTKDGEFLSRSEMTVARKTYGEILNELHDIPLQEVSKDFSLRTYFNARQELLETIEGTEQKLAADKEKFQDEIAKIKSDYDTNCETRQKRQQEIVAEHKQMMERHPNPQKGSAEDRAISRLVTEYKAVNEELTQAKNKWELDQRTTEERHRSRIKAFGIALNLKLKRIQTEYTEALKLSVESEYIKRNRVKNAAEHQYVAQDRKRDRDRENRKTYADKESKDSKERIDLKNYADSNRIDRKQFADSNRNSGRVDRKQHADSSQVDRKPYAEAYEARQFRNRTKPNAEAQAASQFRNRMQAVNKQAADNAHRKDSHDQIDVLGMPLVANPAARQPVTPIFAAAPLNVLPNAEGLRNANAQGSPRVFADGSSNSVR